MPGSAVQIDRQTNLCNHETKHNKETGRMQTGLLRVIMKVPGHKKLANKKFHF
jgi:hypothetical protein